MVIQSPETESRVAMQDVHTDKRYDFMTLNKHNSMSAEIISLKYFDKTHLNAVLLTKR